MRTSPPRAWRPVWRNGPWYGRRHGRHGRNGHAGHGRNGLIVSHVHGAHHQDPCNSNPRTARDGGSRTLSWGLHAPSARRGGEGKIGMAVGPEQRLNPEERANLAAYIDGELTENESRAIATKLSLSPIARRDVESLKQTWELLEFLPRPKASLVFSERTLTSVRSLESRAGSWNQAVGARFAQAEKLAVCLVVAAAGLHLVSRSFAGPGPIRRPAWSATSRSPSTWTSIRRSARSSSWRNWQNPRSLVVPAPAIEAAPCLHSCDRFRPGHWPSWLSQRSRRSRSGQAMCPMTRGPGCRTCPHSSVPSWPTP